MNSRTPLEAHYRTGSLWPDEREADDHAPPRPTNGGLSDVASMLRELWIAIADLRAELDERAGKHEAGLADLEAIIRELIRDTGHQGHRGDLGEGPFAHTRARTYEVLTARSYSRSSSSPQRGERMLSATWSDRRATRDELRMALNAAPLNYDEPSAEERDAFLTAWTKITGQPVSRGMVRPLARAWRAHGPGVVDVLRRRFAITGTTANLIVVMLMEEEPEPRNEAEAGATRSVITSHDRRTGRRGSTAPPAGDLSTDWTADELEDALNEPSDSAGRDQP